MSALARDAWESIGHYYAAPGARERLLGLQERYGVSVTALLTLAWNASRERGAISPGAAARLAERVEAFQSEVLRPLRAARDGLRRWQEPLGQGGRTLRETLLARELDAERLEQLLVLAMLDTPGNREPPGDPLGDLCLSLARYLDGRGVTPDSEAIQALEHLASQALPDYDGVHVGQIWARAWRNRREPQ